MTDNVVIALSTGIPALVAVVFAGLVNLKKLDDADRTRRDDVTAIAKKLDEQNEAAEKTTAEVALAAKEAATAAAGAAVTTETIHRLVNSDLDKTKKERDDALQMNLQLMAILSTAGVKINGLKTDEKPKPT